MAGGPSFRELLGQATAELRDAGVDTARLDAELLLAGASSLDRATLIAAGDDRPGPEVVARFRVLVGRRCTREPLAYITGQRGFRHIELDCDRRALIPRPETELLVELAVSISPDSVIDLGTGTGAIALAVASELPDVRVLGLDTSAAAVALARHNASRLGLEASTRFEHRGLDLADSARLLLANLPYVREGDWETLAPEITGWEPREALTSGADGLDAIRATAELLAPDRFATVAFEVGEGQASDVAALVAARGYEVSTTPDLAGIERMVVGRSADG